MKTGRSSSLFLDSATCGCGDGGKGECMKRSRDLVGRHARRRVSRERRDRRPERRRRGRPVRGLGVGIARIDVSGVRGRPASSLEREVTDLGRGRRTSARRRPHRGPRFNRREASSARGLVGGRASASQTARDRRRRRLVAGSGVGGLSGRRRAEREERRHALSSDHRRDRTCVDNR